MTGSISAAARVKSVLRRTPPYRWLRARRVRRQLAEWTPQDRRMLEFYSGFLAPGDLCFDVGANVGNRVKIFLELGTRVVAVEPQRECAKLLASAFGRHPRFTLVEKALGRTEGRAEMMISDVDIVSSLSQEWIDAVRASGRFAEQRWDRTRIVEVTTLDRLVAHHGAPAFVKIDVEGFESEVVRGLSRPVRALLLEFTPECAASTIECIDHLAKLGEIRLNFSLAESMELAMSRWLDRNAFVEYLAGLGRDRAVWGDIYVRLAVDGTPN